MGLALSLSRPTSPKLRKTHNVVPQSFLVAANVGRKLGLIAVLTVFDCEPLQLAIGPAVTETGDMIEAAS